MREIACILAVFVSWRTGSLSKRSKSTIIIIVTVSVIVIFISSIIIVVVSDVVTIIGVTITIVVNP